MTYQPRHTLLHRRWYGVVATLVLISLGSFSCSPNVAFLIGAGHTVADSLGSLQLAERNMAVFDEAWSLVANRYYDPGHHEINWDSMRVEYRQQADTATSQASLYRILSDMMSVLEDGHTRVESPEAVSREEGNIDVGLGVRGKWVDGRFVIMDVSPYSPAALAGVKPGWILSNWEGVPFAAFVLEHPRYLVREGQTVPLTFIDAEDDQHLVDVTGRFYPRADPQIANIVRGGVLYLRFDRFTDETADWFNDQIFQHKSAPGVVVDLRNNRGGQLSALKDILRNFYRRDFTVGEEIRRDGSSRPLRIDGLGRKAYQGGLVVLTDHSSQSAAEVFSAAVQESGRGILVGRLTAGNVLVSHRTTLPDGGELRISTQDYITSGGRRLEGNGTYPNVHIEPRLEDLRRGIDRDLDAALSLLGYSSDTPALAQN
ncbi:MAG TPA: S41 family peptidase [Rhodothermales bacterium]|nr:S41 family peptidase [Rhodothermales bacterium]